MGLRQPLPRGAVLLLPITSLLTPIQVFAATCETGFAPYMEGNPALKKRGSGTARYLLFRVYDAALYTNVDSESDTDVVAQPGSQPACLEICYHRALSAEVLATAADKVLSEQNSPVELAEIQPQIDQLHNAYKPVSVGDRYRLCRDQSAQLTLSLNGKPLTTVAGREFSTRYLDIWLGERPLSRSLRAELLAERPNRRQQAAY